MSTISLHCCEKITPTSNTVLDDGFGCYTMWSYQQDCRGVVIEVLCGVKVCCQWMKFISWCCRMQLRTGSVEHTHASTKLFLVGSVTQSDLRSQILFSLCFSYFLPRCLTILTRRWCWTSSDIPACWRRSRFDAPASPSGDLSKTSAPGLHQLNCTMVPSFLNTNIIYFYVTDIGRCVDAALLKLCRIAASDTKMTCRSKINCAETPNALLLAT